MRYEARQGVAAGILLASFLGACATRGTPGDGDLRVDAEIAEVNAWEQLLIVRTRDGQVGGVHYDQSTVVYRNQHEFPVSSLTTGDFVTLHMRADSATGLHALRIDIRSTTPEQAGEGALADLREVTGQVMQVDHLSGTFTIQTNDGMVTVSVPHHASRAALNHFQRLRSGMMVRLLGAGTQWDRVELHRFH